MKVLHLIAAVAPRYGGPSAAIWPMLEALHRAGVEVELVTSNADGPRARLDSEDLPKTSFSVHIVSGRSASSSELYEWIDRNLDQYDILHVHGLWGLQCSYAMRLARKLRLPYVILTHGHLAPYSWKRRWWKKWPYWWFIERANLRSASAIQVTSPGENEEVRAWKLPVRVFEIGLGLDDSAFSVPKNVAFLRSKCDFKESDKPILLFVGRLHPVKGITDILLPAFAALKDDAYLAIAGGPAEDAPGYVSSIQNTIARLHLQEHVKLLGSILGAQKWTLYDGAFLYIQSSYTENFGLTVAESMARGCPVVVTEGVQSRSLVEASGGGWIVPLNHTKLTDKIREALRAPEETRKRGRVAQEHVSRELRWDGVANRMIAMYNSSLSHYNAD